jgi:hypothetical protein
MMYRKVPFLVPLIFAVIRHTPVAAITVTYGGDWDFSVAYTLQHDGSTTSDSGSGTTSPFVRDSGSVNGAHARGEGIAPTGTPSPPILKDGPELKGLAEVDGGVSTADYVMASVTIQATNTVTIHDDTRPAGDPIPNLELRLHLIGSLSGTSSGDSWSAYVTGLVQAEKDGQTHQESHSYSIVNATNSQTQNINETFGEGRTLNALNDVTYNLFAELVTTAEAHGSATAKSDFSGNSLEFEVFQTPEAGTWLLFSVGLCVLAGWWQWTKSIRE